MKYDVPTLTVKHVILQLQPFQKWRGFIGVLLLVLILVLVLVLLLVLLLLFELVLVLVLVLLFELVLVWVLVLVLLFELEGGTASLTSAVFLVENNML